jgi:hypothetical protein
VRPRVYAAHPMTSYGTEHERACLDALAALLCGAEIIDPATRYRTNAGWLRAWPRLLRTLAGLVLFADEDGTVGTGCLREVVDAVAAGLPVAYLDPCLGLCELAGLDLLAPTMRTRAATAWPVAGEQVDPVAFCATPPSYTRPVHAPPSGVHAPTVVRTLRGPTGARSDPRPPR